MQYIEIVGVMGTGKSSLARLFNERAGCEAIFEKEEYLDNPTRYGFEGAMNFMGFHLNLIQHSLARMPKDAKVVADVSLLAQHAYSTGFVSDGELDIIQDIIRTAYTKVPPVSLRIVTRLPIEVHVERIRQRGRDFETGVNPVHLEKTQNLLNEAIRRFGNDVPTLDLDGSELNWIESEQDKRTVLRLAHDKLGL
jgi:deoxyadenosine/deoxycytidine kinase